MDPTGPESLSPESSHQGHVDSDAAMVFAVRALISELKTFRERIEEGLVATRRRSYRQLALLIVLIVYVIISTSSIGYLLVSGNKQRDKIGQVVAEVHSAVTPGDRIYEETQRKQAEVITLLTSEQECRIRAALKGLPPVDGESCMQKYPELLK